MKLYVIRYMRQAAWHEAEQEGFNLADARLKFLALHPDVNIGEIYQV